MGENGLTPFEEALCDKILNICAYIEYKKPEMNENGLQYAIATRVNWGKALTQKYQNAEKFNNDNDFKKFKKFENAKAEFGTYLCFESTKLNFNSISNRNSKDYLNLLNNNKNLSHFKSHVDISFNSNNQILEIKYPRNKYCWKYSQKISTAANFISLIPFLTPFYKLGGQVVITDEQEGAMLVDIIRLLRTWDALGRNSELYFAAFFNRADFPEDVQQEEFEGRLLRIFEEYLRIPDNGFAITRNKRAQIDVWTIEKPEDIISYSNESEALTPHCISTQNFKCLHWGDNIVSFLIKLVPRDSINFKWRRGEVLCASSPNDFRGLYIRDENHEIYVSKNTLVKKECYFNFIKNEKIYYELNNEDYSGTGGWEGYNFHVTNNVKKAAIKKK